jgi:hypothetical protein
MCVEGLHSVLTQDGCKVHVGVWLDSPAFRRSRATKNVA